MEDTSSSPQFSGKMIELRGAQLITKSSEFSRNQAPREDAPEQGSTINPFIRNNLQA